jgi:toxin ParE1/3/4
MTRKIFRKTKAIWDVIKLAEYIGQDSPAAALRFMASVEESLKFLLDHPEIAGIWETSNPRYEGMRVWRITGFPHHLIFYRAVPEGIDVFRICHSSRDLDNLFH